MNKTSMQRYREWEKKRQLGEVPPAKPQKTSGPVSYIESVRDGSIT